MEDEGVGGRVGIVEVVAGWGTLELERSGGGPWGDGELEHRDPERLRDVARGCLETPAHHDGPGAQVAKVELELFRPVRRVQGGAHGRRCDGEEGRGCLRAVLDDERDPVVRAESGRAEAATYPPHVVVQGAIRQGSATGGEQRDVRRRARRTGRNEVAYGTRARPLHLVRRVLGPRRIAPH